ncbi:hypothetical protein [Comamonas sp. CMM02]|uniref:hypothetical protein n=1 Tax=Comamonas sp. CMM02 TaxID=2769307 RepID=UPI00177E5976|nr:hypothetical protein [Comamonas sp. CMM02]MBD9400491.1 hypothetical protein [Comamonas sp. CMM02]
MFSNSVYTLQPADLPHKVTHPTKNQPSNTPQKCKNLTHESSNRKNQKDMQQQNKLKAIKTPPKNTHQHSIPKIDFAGFVTLIFYSHRNKAFYRQITPR